MLNYIKAELWKVSRRGVFYVLLFLLLACTALFFWLYSFGYFADLAAAASSTMLAGVLLAPLVVQLVDSGAVDTVKNELSFGLRRGAVYWGKLLASLALGMGFCLVLLGGCLLGGWLLLPHGEADAEWYSLSLVGFCLLGALPIWCGMFALCHTLAFHIHSTAAWVAGYYLLLFLGQPILTLLAILLFNMYEASWSFSLMSAILMPYSLLMPSRLGNWLTGEYQLWCWGIGLGWLAASTRLGLHGFRRRDVA